MGVSAFLSQFDLAGRCERPLLPENIKRATRLGLSKDRYYFNGEMKTCDAIGLPLNDYYSISMMLNK